MIPDKKTKPTPDKFSYKNLKKLFKELRITIRLYSPLLKISITFSSLSAKYERVTQDKKKDHKNPYSTPENGQWFYLTYGLTPLEFTESSLTPGEGHACGYY